jgi:CrcB protein
VTTWLWHAVCVGAGGFIGSVLRFSAGAAVARAIPGASFPLATLMVNVAGCLAIGALAGLGENRVSLSTEVRVFLVVGVLGGFTTFSAFGSETMMLLRTEAHWRALGNILLNVAVGLAAVWIGYMYGSRP